MSRAILVLMLGLFVARCASAQIAELERAKVDLAEDFGVFETCAYSGKFAIEEYLYISLPKDVPDPVSAPGTLVRYSVPPKTSGLITFAATGLDQKVSITPLSVATEHAGRSFAKAFVIRGDAHSVTAIAADGSAA